MARSSFLRSGRVCSEYAKNRSDLDQFHDPPKVYEWHFTYKLLAKGLKSGVGVDPSSRKGSVYQKPDLASPDPTYFQVSGDSVEGRSS